jgi:hypothetical protein
LACRMTNSAESHTLDGIDSFSKSIISFYVA